MPYTIPHVSLQAPAEYIAQYKDKFDDKPYYGQKGYASTKYPRATYAAMISFLDAQVGLIMQHIQKLGLDENTIIMFSSDNGTTFNGGVDYRFFNSVASMRGLKMDVFEGGIREPFLVRWPKRVKANSINAHISAQYDVMATLAELTGQDAGNTDGISFLPTLIGKENQQQKHQYLYFEYPEKGGQLAIRLGDWKGVKLNVREGAGSKWMLFDLKKDRNETTDLGSQYPKIIEQLDLIVKKEHQPAHILEWEFISSKLPKKK